MIDSVLVKIYQAPPVDKREALRYAGCKGSVPEVEELLDECIEEGLNAFTYKVCYREFPVQRRGETLDLGFMTTASKGLLKNLDGCFKVVAFAATVGLNADRLMAKYEKTSSAKALVYQAFGAERVEALCDTFNQEIDEECRKSGFYTRPRFSPGYGDLPLEAQKSFFSVLDCHRKIGLSLNDSLLISPTKSVTALIGVGKEEKGHAADKCSSCGAKACLFRENF